MEDVKIIRRGMIYVAKSGKTTGKGFTEQEALMNLQKKLDRKKAEDSPDRKE
ncbi:hypothetical protein C8P63_10223 [Melghirimyces profundicolus]|uniref:Uncharacterized protein n=1 Tax=Melghirimyces profundicolus TaxID=1242148 RepID=A0A2T6C884_9BACL|nr:hypothetical protein [Melghirimyces profundicolus]PTX64530.1 hypothetical protein C8P63_10223 [Melghirimyces profundicolus]